MEGTHYEAMLEEEIERVDEERLRYFVSTRQLFTDGDLRRALDEEINVHKTLMKDVMHENSRVAPANILAAEAVHLMEEYKITSLLVADADGRLVGALNIHDLFRAGVM